ncbi:MAG TPA: hypothetical protein VFI99_02775 [Nocardioides sp.]|jgi:hypothetical protein|nr:hypothetical protein [Nocardioides sp.]
MKTPLSDRPLDLTLHIGMGKAGSSSIQSLLSENRHRLADLGYLYPQSPGTPRHSRLGLYVKSNEELKRSPVWHKRGRPDPARLRRAFRRRLLAEIEGSGLSRVILSDEVLFPRDRSGLLRLRRFTDKMTERLRVVVYLRRQDEHLVSRYQQGMKVGRVERLREFAEDDWSALYHYYARLRVWSRLMEPTELVVRRFEPHGFVGGSLHRDFLDAANIDVRVEDLEQVHRRNESLDAESVEFLRLVNLYRAENEGATPGLMHNWKLFRQLAEASTGPVLTMSDAFLDKFMTQWEEANRRVAIDFLGDSSGQLFRTPRKTLNTTTEQLLDPARLDHFLTLTELPERIHVPLRRLAEREARIR